MHIESQVHEFAPNSRIGWFGQGTGMDAYHTFLLLKAPEGCRVVTEEVVRGPGAVEFRKKDPQAMHRGHDLWLSALKQVQKSKTEPSTLTWNAGMPQRANSHKVEVSGAENSATPARREWLSALVHPSTANR